MNESEHKMSLHDSIRFWVSFLSDAKDLPDVVSSKIIQSVMKAVATNAFGKYNYQVVFNNSEGVVELYKHLTVVPDDEFQESFKQIKYTDAIAIDPTINLGDVYSEIVDFSNVDNFSFSVGKKVAIRMINQHHRATEGLAFETGRLVVGQVVDKKDKNYEVDVGFFEAKLPFKYCLQQDDFQFGEEIEAVVYSAFLNEDNSIRVTLTRNTLAFMEKKIKKEIPEIRTNMRHLATRRTPGKETKMVLLAYNEQEYEIFDKPETQDKIKELEELFGEKITFKKEIKQ